MSTTNRENPMALRKIRLPSGTERWQASYATKDGRRHAKNFDRKRDAESWLASVKVEMLQGLHVPLSASPTVREAADAYTTYMEGRWKRDEHVTRRHYETVKGLVSNYVLSDTTLAETRLAELTAGGVAAWRDRIRNKGTSVPLARKALGTLSRIIDHAISTDRARINPCSTVTVIGSRSEDVEPVTAPAKLTVKAALEAAGKIGAALRIAVLFAASTGVRASEQWALVWSDIDLSGATVTVSRRVDAYGELDTTKSRAGRRTIPLSATVVNELRKWKLSSGGRDDGLVFPAARGGYRNHSNFLRRDFADLLEAMQKEGVEDTFNWHALRHFAVSTWIESGMQLKEIQTLAGHATAQMTLDRYGHMFPKAAHHTVMNDIAAELFA